MAVVAQQRTVVGIAPACAALSVARATFYRRQKPQIEVPRPPRQVPRALPPDEQKMVLSMLNDDRFAGLAPAQVYTADLEHPLPGGHQKLIDLPKPPVIIPIPPRPRIQAAGKRVPVLTTCR